MKQIFIAAKNLIDQHGLAKGFEQVFDLDHRYGYCVVTACGASRAILPWTDSLSIVEAFRSANGIDPNLPLGDWNDVPERTKAEVLAAFDKAIEASDA